MGGSPSAAAAAVSVPPTAASEPSAAAAASSPPPVDTFTGPGRDEVAFAKAAAEAAASATQAPTASEAAAEGASAGEEDEEEEAGSNKGAANNPTHNWFGSAVEEGELESMAADGVIPPASSTSPAWRSALDDPYPTPVRDERVLLSSHVSRGYFAVKGKYWKRSDANLKYFA